MRPHAQSVAIARGPEIAEEGLGNASDQSRGAPALNDPCRSETFARYTWMC